MSGVGKLIVVGVLLAAVVAAGVGFAVRYYQADQVHRLWGADAVELITSSSEATLLVLAPLGDADFRDTPGEVIESAAGRYGATQSRSIQQADGFLNLRHALREDRSYDWNAEPPTAPMWKYALRLTDQSNRLTLLFDADCRTLSRLDRSRVGLLTPQIAAGVEKLFRENLD